LRLIITPTTPIVKSTAESARYHESCGTITTEIRNQTSEIGTSFKKDSLFIVTVGRIRNAE
jgi:hypothetical protein